MGHTFWNPINYGQVIPGKKTGRMRFLFSEEWVNISWPPCRTSLISFPALMCMNCFYPMDIIRTILNKLSAWQFAGVFGHFHTVTLCFVWKCLEVISFNMQGVTWEKQHSSCPTSIWALFFFNIHKMTELQVIPWSILSHFRMKQLFSTIEH